MSVFAGKDNQGGLLEQVGVALEFWLLKSQRDGGTMQEAVGKRTEEANGGHLSISDILCSTEA